MKKLRLLSLPAALLGLWLLVQLPACQPAAPPVELDIFTLDSTAAAQQALAIREEVSAVQILDGLEMKLWASDSLAPDPIALAIDDLGRVYLTRTNRQENSEFDIRGHRDWATASISWKSVEDRRAFLREHFSPENSDKNDWLDDLNGDSLHDWRDLAVEKEEVLRLEDRDGDGVAEFRQRYTKDFHEEVTDPAGALLPFGDDVFVGAGPDLWQLRDENGDGQADYKRSISHGYAIHIGFGGHGMSGLTYGPDGKIYWSIGDIGMNAVDFDGRRWYYPNEGVIVRSNPDGSDFEVFAAGLRNTHEFVFDDYGNLISVDNDGDHPGESERLVYIVNGSDSGWRANWQYGKYTDPDNNTYKVWMDEGLYLPRHEGQAAYILPPIRNYHNGPAGMAYHPGTALNDSLKGHFFVAEFVGSPARSNVYAFRLQPKGAGFDFRDEKVVLNGVLATGLDFGPDGALYLADWIDGWGTKDYGRVWRLDDPRQAGSDLRRTTQQLLAADLTEQSPEALGELLRNADQRVRLKAQFELAKRGNKGRNVFLAATQGDHQLARIHGIWGLGQLARQKSKTAEDLLPLLTDADAEIRAQAAKLLGDVRYGEAGDQLIPLLQDTSARVRFFAAEALGRMGHQPAVQPIIAMLEANNDADEYLRHAGSLALARIGQAAPIVALAGHSSRALRVAAVVALRRMRHPDVACFLMDADEYVVTEAARAINDDRSIPGALPDLAMLVRQDRLTNEALMRRAINANLRVGRAENLQWLLDYALRPTVAEALRAEAIATLGTWAAPSVTDRVDGYYRGPIERELEPVQAALRPLLPRLLDDQNVNIQAAAALAAGKLQLGELSPKLFALVSTHVTPQVRLTALRALTTLKAEQSAAAIQLALNDSDRQVRVTALELVTTQDLPPQQLVDLFRVVLEKASIEEQQAALRALEELPLVTTSDLLDQLLNQLTNGSLPRGIELELMETIETSESEALRGKLADYRAGLDQDDPIAPYRETLEGGNRGRGRDLFLSHEASQCVRCHSLEAGEGSDVGPMLAGIGSKYDREELLRSLVAPSERIAPGYGVVVLTLADGNTISGIVKAETDAQLTLQVGENEQTVAKSNIVERIDAASSMPAMGPLLTKRELRDMVAFLASLREDVAGTQE